MAEFVQHSIEEMLPELEQMERVELFTNAETRAILKKRTRFEYKLRRRIKLKEDYLQYIQYEMNVLALLKKRRESNGYFFKKDEIDGAIVRRINKHFKLAIFRFQEDVDLWLSHIDFCKKRSDLVYVSKMYSQLLQVHNRNPGLWIVAAKWEIEIQNSMENARSLLQRGLRFNNSKELWLEYFRMELLNADKHRKRQEVLGMAHMDDDSEEVSDAVKNGMVALLIYNKAMEAIPDGVLFSLSFLPILRLFDFTQHIENHIFTRLEHVCPLDEVVWEARARRLLDALPNITKDPKLSKKDKVKKIIEAEKEFCDTFEVAVQNIKTERIWALYIKSLLQLLEEPVPSKLKTKRVHVTLAVFGRANEANLLTEELHLEWMTVLLNVGLIDEAWQVSQSSVKRFPTSVGLWKKYLEMLICQTTEDKQPVLDATTQALQSVKDKKSLPLWQLATKWYILQAPRDEVESILEKGLTKCSDVCSYVKEQYLIWAAFNKSIKHIRQLYTRLTATQPVSLEFFHQYILLEKSQIKMKMKHVRKAYDDALDSLGEFNPDLWLEYIKLEMYHPNGDPENVGKIHWRAMQKLEGSDSEQFVMKFTLLQAGHES